MSGNHSRNKGLKIEREIVKLHTAIGVYAERVPLSGATKYGNNGEDVDVHPLGKDHGRPFCCQVKANLSGTKGLFKALGDADALFLRYDAEPGYKVQPVTVVLPWETWEFLLSRVK